MADKQINPNLRKLAELTYNPSLELPNLEELKEQPQTSAPELKGMIYVPSINLYVAKEKSLLGKNWYDAHKELQKQRARMPTIPEFVEFLKYLRDNPNNENTNLYNEVTQVRDPWRGEWLDADFKVKNKQLYINYNHRVDSQGNLKPLNTEKLEDCLMEDCYADILNPNKQGLPTKKSKNKEFYYWFPRSDNNSVAGFVADSAGALLGCLRYPDYSDSSLGVRVVREAPQKSIFKIK